MIGRAHRAPNPSIQASIESDPVPTQGRKQSDSWWFCGPIERGWP